ncbi:RluA family pseudouridine synthase [Eubacteriaceae bacterium ES2]|nr:RluA family pseudouridine synthase [Eubacteriaceae bacterium ES2]
METYELNIENQADMRLDLFCASQFGELSREFFKNLIKDDQVMVNGKSAKASYRLKTGDVVMVNIPEAKPCDIAAEKMDLNIVYEDDDVLIINKPRGMVVHPAPGNYSGTLVNGIMAHTGHLSTINGVMRPGIVHRIDKDTSGLLMIAKNNKAHQSLTLQLMEHSVIRLYYAIVVGIVDVNEGKIDMPIGRDPRNRLKMAVVPENSKEAITHFKVIKRFAKHSLVRFQLETGRTHQIRVHMAKIGYPILGDSVYGKDKFNKAYIIKGQCLHAQALGFVHPETQNKMLFKTRVPEDFLQVLKRLNVG